MALTKIDDRGLKTPIDLLDGEKIRFGTGNDLEIYHNSGEDQIRGTGTKFEIRSPNLQLQNSSAEKYIVCTSDGSVDLYYDNVKRFETTSDGVQFTGHLLANDDGRIKLGNSQDLQIYHHSSHDSYIVNDNGFLGIKSTEDIRLTSTSNELMVKAIIDGAVELYYDGGKKLETTSSGATITGGLYCSAGQQIQITGTPGSVGLQLIGQDADYSLIGTMGAHDLMFRTTSAERMRIAANGVLWHGVAPFANHFTNRSAYFHKSGSSDWNYFSITGGTSGGAGIVFGDSVENNTGNYESLIAHDNTNNSLYLKTAQTAKGLEIKVGGDVHVIDGNLSLASGHGIDFSATANGTGSSQAELLDDYEEGTWTPTSETGTWSSVAGLYTKIGNKVFIRGYMYGCNDESSSSDVKVTGLPFTGTNNEPAGTNISQSSGDFDKLYFHDNSGSPYLRFVENDGAGSLHYMAHSDLGSSGGGAPGTLHFVGFYNSNA